LHYVTRSGDRLKSCEAKNRAALGLGGGTEATRSSSLIKHAEFSEITRSDDHPLVSELAARAREFNKAFEDEERQIDTIQEYDNAFIAWRRHLPEVEAQVQADYEANLISLVVSSRTVGWKLPAKEINERYRFDLQSSGNLNISDGSKAISNDALIGLLFQPFFRFK
jgi:hypothetical protein